LLGPYATAENRLSAYRNVSGMDEMKGLLSTDDGVFMVTIRPIAAETMRPARPVSAPRAKFPKTLRIRLLNAQHHRCAICNGPLGLYDSHIDHVMPRAMGGSDDVSNLQLTHMSCNTRKGGQTLSDRHADQEPMPWA
jgi:5-methylcytosine-specific restriction protein A